MSDIPLKDEKTNSDPKVDSSAFGSETSDESRAEKLRRAKIAMEGLDRTIRREANEKEEEVSSEKQQLNKLLLSIDHEKELLELTWVNLDDKRSGLKQILEPILQTEDKIQSSENELESREDVTLSPNERRGIEEERWSTQEKRHQTEQEKWLIEEKVAKIEQQITELKTKYQALIKQEEEIRQKIQAIDEQLLLQQEVLSQQRELAEQKKRQEALRQLEEEKKRQEVERPIVIEKKPAPIIKPEPKTPDPAEAEAAAAQALKLKQIEKLRLQEESRQKQENVRFQVKTPETPQANNNLLEKETAIKRALELERVKRENEEAEKARQQAKNESKTVIKNFEASGDEGFAKPLRTLQSDLDAAVENKQVNAEDLGKLNKQGFSWFKK